MDLVYPIKGGPTSGPDPLKWSLRTVERHSTPGEIFVAGSEPPPWLNLEAVRWIDVPLAEHKRDHTGLILEAVLSSDISEEFLWMNDDFFLLEDREEWPVWGRPSLREHIEEISQYKRAHGPFHYGNGLETQLRLLEEWGFLDPPSLDIHVPLPLTKTVMAGIYTRGRAAAPTLPRGFFRSLYVASEVPVMPLYDVKLYKHTDEIPRGGPGLVSTSPVSWNVGRLGKALRSRYWKPSRFER